MKEVKERPFLVANGLADARIVPLQSGRNNHVWRVESEEGLFLLKSYRQSVDGEWDRLATEYQFLEILRDGGVRQVPKPVAQSKRDGLGLYTFLSGQPVERVTVDLVKQCADFVIEVNDCQKQESAGRFPVAADAHFDIQSHLSGVHSRLSLLRSIEVGEGLVCRFSTLINSLVEALRKIDKTLVKFAGMEPSATDGVSAGRILSPSDFGFHNILEEDGVLCFLDFEYAGWDDPAKLICDFNCQPDHQIDRDLGQLFAEELSEGLDDHEVLLRASLLLPLYRLRWCCIMLNSFRAFAPIEEGAIGSAQFDRFGVQLERATSYFNEHLGGV